MGDKDEIKSFFADDKSKSQRFSDFMGKLLITFFDIFYLQFKISHSQFRQNSKQRQKFFHALNMILYTLQLVSLVFPPETQG